MVVLKGLFLARSGGTGVDVHDIIMELYDVR